MPSTQTRIQIRQLSNFTTDPSKSGEKMLMANLVNIKPAKIVQKVNLLVGLEIRKIGINAI